MGGSIEVYLDIASFYSYVAFVQIQQTRELLAEHGVKVNIKPCLIGALNAGSKNSPPWTVPAKAAQLELDMHRVIRAAGLPPNVSSPGDLFTRGRTMLPMRMMHFLKDAYPESVFMATFHVLFYAFWVDHEDLTKPDTLAPVLAKIPADGKTGSLFTEAQVKEMLTKAGESKYKESLRQSVEEALARGAYGAPWLWVTPPGDTDGKKAEPFFGSDRWHYVYELLGLPYTDVKLLGKKEAGGAKL